MNVILRNYMTYYIYKICCDDCPEYVYVGSTKAFRQRKAQHKLRCKTTDTKLYNTIRENGGWNNWRMVILEDCGEIPLTESRIKEEEYRVKLNCNMNSKKCHTTEEEYKEYFKEYHNEYYQKNIEKLKEYHKEYNENNKEKRKENNKEYREKNKEKIKERHAQPYTCECGRTFRIDGKAPHERTLFHKQFMEQKNNSI